MKPDPTSDPNATQTASPSTAEPPSTIEPTPGARPTYHRPSASAQLRDPDRYQIINEHGRGGLGRVSRAHDRDLGRDVAIKELISRGTLSEVRFLREALITARLEHPGIVPVHEAGRWPDSTPFYAMKLVAGRPLRDLIQERTTVAERIGLLHHVIAVADAIAYAHGRNIIHRDLKPANVIVGDFGETIVIDWGLAKDLSTTEEATVGGGPFRANHDTDLTSTGSVLGTPAYMAPEQERGEHVDQRADVFAIGAMLWELCSLQKVPPTDQRIRHRLLRRAGIDQDLVTIIDKALDPDPKHRYPNAGDLAADLKAFKTGARIAARSYSLLALLMHWTRRHRAFALSLVAAVVVSAASIALYIHDVNAERQHAETARAAADLAASATKAALAEQTLGHAEVLLTSDPSAAIDVLALYQGVDQFRHDILHAKAIGIGVAQLRAMPHTDSVLWAHELTGGRIATLSADGSVAVTAVTGAVTVIDHGANNRDTWSYSEDRHLLAYVCGENELCMLDFSGPSPIIISRFASLAPEGVAFSPDSRTLVSVSRTRDLIAWDVTRANNPTQSFTSSARGFNVGFLGARSVVAVDTSTVTISTQGVTPRTISIGGASNTASSRDSNAFAIGTEQGIAVIISIESTSVTRQAQLCEGPLQVLHFTDSHKVVAYGCKDGKVGLWHLNTPQLDPLTTIQGAAGELAISADGRYLAVGGSAGIVSLVDLHTRIVSQRLGHSGKISAIASLKYSDRIFATADLNGGLRIWTRPPQIAQIAYRATSRLYAHQFITNTSTIVTTGLDASLHFTEDSFTRSAVPHDPGNNLLELAPNGVNFASFGSQNNIELWDGERKRITNAITLAHTEVVQLKFISEDELVYANKSGQVIVWSASTGPVVLAAFPQPISTFVLIPTNVIVIELRDGTLHRLSAGGAPIPVTQANLHEHIIRVSDDRRWLVTADKEGEAVVYDTRTWTIALRVRVPGPIRHVAIAPRNDLLVISTRSGELYLGPISGTNSTTIGQIEQWNHVSTHALFAAFTPNGDLLMVTNSDGFVWFYSSSHKSWQYFFTGAAGLGLLKASQDGRHAATTDSSGRLTTFDLDAVRELIFHPAQRLKAFETQDQQK